MSPVPTDARPVDCGSCAARMQMAVQDWWCPVCGWWWVIAEADSGVKAIGCSRDSDQVASLDITGWVVAASASPSS